MNERQRKIEELKMFFLDQLVEDPQNGTSFDCDVLNTLEALDKKYAKTDQERNVEEAKIEHNRVIGNIAYSGG